jgi:hypothetical protein
MGTHCIIAIENDDGLFHSIYCHFDGYPSGVGKILTEHYSDRKKVMELIALGDISSLGKEIGTKHNFDTHHENTPDECNAYYRDREEYFEDTRPSTYNSFIDLLFSVYERGGSYFYLFGLNDCWKTMSIEEILDIRYNSIKIFPNDLEILGDK